MLIAIISDLHSNLEALTTAINYIDRAGVDEIWCLGDIVGYGPSPNECVEMVREKCTLLLRGNHDAGAIGDLELSHFNEHGQAAIKWTRAELTFQNREYLNTLPLTAVRRDIMLAHATPADPESWRYVLTWSDAIDAFMGSSSPLCFIGHTHVPLIIGEDHKTGTFRQGVRHLINVGSVGQPRDGNPKASFGLLDTDLGKYENIRLAYDIEKVIQAVQKAGLPEQLGKRLLVGI
jgi:diadenosine tetraphosphatase ApaH/serine/threonine PP2A family protein phosphatase